MNVSEIANKLIELRGDRTQEEVAKALGISQEAISFYENGKRIPSDDTKIKIAKYYGTTVQSIFFED